MDMQAIVAPTTKQQSIRARHLDLSDDMTAR